MLVPDNLVHLPAAKLPDDAAGRNTPQIPDMKTDDVRKINQSRHYVFPFLGQIIGGIRCDDGIA